ncbi:TPA: hypothetical protein DCW54_01495 [Candidatus Dependentiae bacterium]|nr:hypothetical protein [Candidatus Dependentiae bacterium]
MKKNAILHIVGLLAIAQSATIHHEAFSRLQANLQSPKSIAALPQEPWVTIFIHGTLGVEKLMNFETILTLLKRSIDGTRYQRLMECLREHPYSYAAQAAQLPGLRPIEMKNKEQNSAELFARLYDIIQKRYFPEQTAVEWLTFGWSGAINHLQRVQDAKELFEELSQYVKQKKETFPNLKVRLVTYSHGSNIALNLEYWRDKSKEELPFQIDELIMLGTPVIVESEDYIYSPLFKNIYSIYSRHDMASILDLFSTRGTFPRRRFHKKHHESFPPNFKQVEIELTLTAKNNLHQPNNSNRTIEKSPGHLEMWIFGWPDVTIFCRRHFPLSPLPAALLAPAIVAHYRDCPSSEHDEVFCYKTDEGFAYTRKRFSTEKTYFDFIEPEFITSLQSYAWNFWHNRMSQTEKDAIQVRCNGILKGLLC